MLHTRQLPHLPSKVPHDGLLSFDGRIVCKSKLRVFGVEAWDPGFEVEAIACFVELWFC